MPGSQSHGVQEHERVIVRPGPVSGNSAGYIGYIENLGPGAPDATKPKLAAPRYLEADGNTIRGNSDYCERASER